MKNDMGKFITAVLIAAPLVACGGGGSSGTATASTSTPVPASAPTPAPSPSPSAGPSQPPGVEGVFQVAGNGHTSYATLLEGGEFYSFDTWNMWTGLEHGTLSGSSAQFSSSPVTLYNYGDSDGGSIVTGSASGSYADPTLTLSVVFGAADNYTYTGTQITYASGDARTIYDNPIPVSDLAGVYQGQLHSAGGRIDGVETSKAGKPISGLTVNADGSFDIAFSDCAFHGNLTAHGTKGIFDLSVNASGAACDFAGSMNGILTPIEYSGSSTRLVFQLLNGAGTQSIVLFVQKS